MKTVIILFIILSEQLIFASVDTRIVYVSNTPDVPSPGVSTLVLDVEAISNTCNVQVSSFQDAIQLDDIFRAQTLSVFFSNQLFPLSGYTTNEDYRASEGRIRYLYTHYSGTCSTVNSKFTRILTISIQYATGSSNGSISWFSGSPNYLVADNTPNDITVLNE